MKDALKITNVHSPTDEKDNVNEECCDNNLLSSFNKIDTLSEKYLNKEKVSLIKSRLKYYN